MAPTRMKLRVRRRDNAAAGAAGRGAPPEEEEEQRSRESGSRRKSASRSSAAAATTTSSSLSPPTSSASTSARPPMMAAEEASPDSKCPICLDRFNKLAYLDRCKHRFCFPCIQEWSHKKPECPLCKQPFTSIFHRNHAEDDFKEYSLRPAPASSSVASTVAMVAAMASAARNSHQMRLMLRRHRVPETGETTTRRRRRERGGRRAEERAGIWEWYLDSPTLPLPPLPHPPVVTEDSEDGEEQGIRGGAEMAERGVVFEGLTGLGGAVAPIAPNDRASRQLMSRLAARQRLQREGGTVRRLRERETVAFRRELYRCGIRVRGIGGIPENQWQWQRDVTAEGFRQNPAHLNRLRPWLRRELTVLYGSHTSLVDIVQRIIIARLARYGLENTPIIEEELRPFLLARTEHFMHELVSFARSPLSLDNYDLQAVYEPPDAAVELDGMSSSSEGSSVIAISEEEEERTRGGGSEERPEREGGAHDDIIQTASVLSLSGWDDETPGPSYSTAEPSSSFSPALPEAANQDGGERLEEEEECLIVGYKKPIAERTPELVQLSSDTEEEEEKKKKEEELPPPPSATPPLSYLSMIPPSTSGTYREEQDKGQKDGEVAGQHARARSWSGSSGRSRSSVCTLSPATPGDSERRRETGSWRDRKSAGEASREKRRKRKRERSTDRHRKSGTLFNPNRSIYPAMMRHRSPSPFDSSADSSSLPSPSPPDSSWEYPCAQVSPLTSSVSSPSHSSSSPRPPPPPRTPPTPSLSPSNRSGPHHGEKPGGKRKYKSRHLDNNVKDPTWRPSSSGGGRKEKRKERRRRRERERGRRRERHRRVSSGYGGESSRRSREDRSPSVEIIYEGTITSEGVQPSARKRRRKRHRKAQQSSSPVIITLDSDSSRDDPNNKNSGSISSSPLSSQQTVDFSDLPPLPLVHSAGVSSVLDAEIGDLPVDILDRGSGSDTEPAGQSKATVQGYSDHEVDVENVDDDVEGPVTVTKTPDPESQREAGTAGEGSQPMGEHDAAHVMTDLLHKRLPEASTSDSHLLASILSDLDRISAPKCEASLNIEARCSPDSRKRRYRDPCAVSQAHQQQGGWVADFPEEQQSDVRAQNQESTSIDSPPPLKQWKECRVGEEGRDAPPLLRQASPVRSYNRNTPPPLKHKDAGSPRHSPLFNSDLRSHHASSDPVLHSLNPTDSPSDSRLAAKLPNDSEAIPPISTLKRHLTSMLALSGDPASTSSISAKARALTTDFHPSGHRLPVGTSSSFGCETTPTAADYYSFNPSALHSSRESTMGISSSHSPVDLNPVTSSSNTDFHSAAGWSKETPAHPHSTSRGCVNKTTNSFWPPLVDLHPFSSVAGAPPAGSRVSSGVNSHDTLLPVSVTDPRTQKASSPSDSPSSSNLSLIGSTAAPSSMPSTMNLHPVDFHSSSAASGGRTDRDTTLAVSREERLPPELDCRGPNLQSSCLTDARLNHTAFSSSSAPPEHSISFHTSHKTSKLGTDSSLFHPNHVDPRSKHNLPPDSEPPPPKFSRRGFEHHTDNHITPESQRNSNSPTDAHPYERSAT
ncbi:E3 ubiquitin-protein ligase Topors isoform X2 [Archocentrus centrarchus]|nr:E3 ubiquitin-protein ligase Topors-like isoform X2 [Archocentrus centrarchus]XP_030609748.1 E3 ubiquitin-protein ligase Topors-like isoform X2 [Archocentrus centrarchus]